jgi:hypothetical protein
MGHLRNFEGDHERLASGGICAERLIGGGLTAQQGQA